MLTPLNFTASVPAPGQHLVEPAGRVVGGRYRLDARIAGGAMGSIWRAQHVELRCAVAIKFFDISGGSEAEMYGRFLQEARSTAAVRCAHVVQVFDYGTEGNVPYIVMELLEGETLEQRLRRRGVLSPLELDKIFREVVTGVTRSHATGVIHRDLKPSNIFIANEGSNEVTKVIDFGIAEVDEARLGFSPRVETRAGTVIGTPDYMSPEQLRAGGEINGSVDLWALAIIAFECLTGRPPFTGKSLTDLIVQICTETPVLPSTLATVPAGFDRWFRKATHRHPGTRFSSADEMAAALSPILGTGRPSPPPERAPTREPRGGTRWLGSVVVDANLLHPTRVAPRWSWAAKLHRAARAWFSPVRAGLALGMLVGVIVVIAFRTAPTQPVPTASEATVRPALRAAVAPGPEASSANNVSRASSEQPGLVIAPSPVKSLEPASIPSPSAAPQPTAVASVNGSVAGQPRKSPPERRVSAPTPSRPSAAEPSRPSAVEATSSPPIPDGEALFAERL